MITGKSGGAASRASPAHRGEAERLVCVVGVQVIRGARAVDEAAHMLANQLIPLVARASSRMIVPEKKQPFKEEAQASATPLFALLIEQKKIT